MASRQNHKISDCYNRIFIYAVLATGTSFRYNGIMLVIRIKTQTREEIVDITATLQDIVKKEHWQSGILTLYSPHTTAALSVNENADPDVKRDLLSFLKGTIPPSPDFKHREGNSDAHIKGALINFSQTFLIENSRIQLGTWQGIFFMEFDGPRSREIWVKFIAG